MALRSKLLAIVLVLLPLAAWGQQGTEHGRVILSPGASVIQDYVASAVTITPGQILVITAGTTTVSGIAYGNVQPITATATSGAFGVAVTGGASGQVIEVAISGQASVISDNACTAGQPLWVSTTTNGSGHCASLAATEQVGYVIAAIGSPGLVEASISAISSSSASGVASITGDGTIFNNSASTGPVTLTRATQSAHTALMGPTSGGAVVPTFRLLVAGDIPLAIPIGNVGTAGLSATSPITISAAGVIACATCTTGGTVTVTGSPLSGELTAFSSASSITNSNLSGDVTTSNSLVATVVGINGAPVPANATVLASVSSQLVAAPLASGDVWVGNGSNIPVAQVASLTLNSQTVALGGTGNIPFAHNSTPDTSLAGLNFLDSTADAVGLHLAVTNPATNQIRLEVSGGSYTGNAATATALAATPSQCTGQYATGIAANGNANCHSIFYQTVKGDGSSATQEPALNLISGTNLTVACVDNAGVSTDCTLTASNTAATAFSAITAATNSNAGNFIASGNAWDFSAATSFKAPKVGLIFPGSSSGTATVIAQAAAGTPTLTLPNATGTFAVSASAPLVLSATTGNLTASAATTGALGVIELAGDLGGTGASPSVLQVHGVAYGATPSTNTVPVITGSNTATYEAVPNAALAHSSVLVNNQTCVLGGSDCLLYAADTGTANTYVIAPTVPINSLVAGAAAILFPANANTGASTINVSSLGVKAITKNGTTALVSGDLLANAVYHLVYDGTEWQVTNPSTFASSGANTSLSNLTTTSINQDLIPATPGANLGTVTDYWNLTVGTITFAGTNGILFQGPSTGCGAVTSGNAAICIGSTSSFVQIYDPTDTTLHDVPEQPASAPTAGDFVTFGATYPRLADSGVSPSTISPGNTVAGAGSVNVMTATPTICPASLVLGTIANVLPNLANTTTTPTLNWCSLGAKTITKAGTIALRPGDYNTTQIAQFLYDGTRWQLMNPVAPAHGIVWACSWSDGTGHTAPTAGTVIASCGKSIPANFLIAGDVIKAHLNTEVTTNGSNRC